jgi:hypothetical protein
MIAPKKDAENIYALISPQIKPVGNQGAYGIPCSKVAGLNATITFNMGGQKYTIPSQELIVGRFPRKTGEPEMCQTLISYGRAAPFWIIGGSLMKYYYTVWDVDRRRLGWATTAHSPTIH